MKYLLKKLKGIGLIEVLITTLVVALGLLAVASLQGNLMGTSGSNKARAEAKALCENRLEQFRDAVSKGLTDSTTAGEYSAIGMADPAVVTGTAPTRTGITTENGLVGVNETFTRVTVVTELIDPVRKQINVTCSWGNGDDDHQVVVQSILGFDSLAAAVKVAKPEGGIAMGNPSTNAGSSTEIHDRTDVPAPGAAGELASNQEWAGKETGQYLKVNEDNTTSSIVYKCTGETGAYPFITFDAAKGLYTRRIHNPNVADNLSFLDAIELAKSNHDNLWGTGLHSCTRKIRYNGGIMLPVKGTVYSKTSSNNSLIDVNLFTFDASESGIYCAFSPASGATLAPYVCYAGGNCINGPVGTHVTTDGITITTASTGNAVVTECPTATPPTGAYSTVGPGGWRGEVGLLGIPTSNAAHNNVCFAEEVAAIPAVLNTARNYYTRRFTGTAAKNEGINKPYMCHDFLIIDGKNSESAIHTECAARVGVLKLASKIVMRDFSAATSATNPLNSVDLSVNKASCHIITGTVTDGVTAVTATSTTGFFDCLVNTDADTYECDGTALGVNTGTTGSPVYTASVLVSEVVSSGTPHTCTATLTTSNTNVTCNLASAAATRNVAVTVDNAGTTTGTTAVISVLDSSTTPAFTCVPGSGSIYNCTVPGSWTGTIKALSTCNANPAADATVAIASTATTSATIILPVCAASTTHNLVVTVNPLGQGITAINSVTTSGGVNCALTTGTTYHCVVDNAWTGTVTVVSTCNGAAAANATSSTLAAGTADATTIINLPSCAAVEFTLTVTAPANGTIKDRLTVPVINCGSACSASYTSGSTVFLVAVPDTGYGFLSWGGACAGITIPSCAVDMTAAKSVSATFTPAYTLTTSAGTGGTISPATGVYNSGTVVTVTAAANSGYVFSSWSGACTGTGACSVTMNGNKSVTATFVQTCNVAISGRTDNGSTAVTSSLGCAVTSASSRAYTCPVKTAVANGTVVTMTNTGQPNKTFTVSCPTTAYTVSW